MSNLQALSTKAPFLELHPNPVGYQAIFGSGPDVTQANGGIATSLINSVVESGGAMIMTIIIAVFGAYAFARLRFRLKPVLFYGILFTLALPTYATLIPLYKIMIDLHGVNTYWGIIVVFASGLLPLSMWIIYNTFLTIPAAIEEAALVDGAGTLQTFFRIALPIAAPGIAASAIIAFLFAWGQFIFPLVLSNNNATEPLTVWMSSLQTREPPYNIINAAALISVAVPTLLVVGVHRWIVQGIVAGSVK
jgi:multiple sugar transport system permease protein